MCVCVGWRETRERKESERRARAREQTLATMPAQPMVKWAQRDDKVFITIEVFSHTPLLRCVVSFSQHWHVCASVCAHHLFSSLAAWCLVVCLCCMLASLQGWCQCSCRCVWVVNYCVCVNDRARITHCACVGAITPSASVLPLRPTRVVCACAHSFSHSP